MFLRLCDLRGYENLLMDMYDEEPLLWELIEQLDAFNLDSVRRWCEMDLDYLGFAEDLGMQVGPMLSPSLFKKYIVPSYRKLFAPAKEKGLPIILHSDGDLHSLMEDIIELGVNVINPQDLVNGIDWLKENVKGKMCIDLDVDRQNITVLGTSKDVDALIRREVEELGSPEGGFMLGYGIYPGTPIENAAAAMNALEKYAFYYT